MKIRDLILNNQLKFVALLMLVDILFGMIGILNGSVSAFGLIIIPFGYVLFIYGMDLNQFFSGKKKNQ